MVRKLPFFLLLLLAALNARADEQTLVIPPGSAELGIEVFVPVGASILHVTARSDNGTRIDLLLRKDAPFEANGRLFDQADYVSSNVPPANPASLSVGTYATPALSAGTWHLAIANRSARSSTSVTLTTSVDSNPYVETEFIVNFGEPSQALKDLWDDDNPLECDVSPWSDPHYGNYRRDLVSETLDKLSQQVFSPIPIHVQACWRDYSDDGDDTAGDFTLASAGAIYYDSDAQGLPLPDAWYAMAPAERLAGRRFCHYYSEVDCTIPEIIVWYNSANVAADFYNGNKPAAVMRSITMHEIVHGLGFLSTMSLDSFELWDHKLDAYLANVAWLTAPADDPHNYVTLTPLAQLGLAERKAAVTSGQFLVWNDPDLAASDENILSGRPAPRNLVELYAPDTIYPGSTLSHLAMVHSGQLMTPMLQPNHPEALGLAKGVLARAGWNIGPTEVSDRALEPVTGNWYDPAHSGHGIDLQLIKRDSAGNQYGLTFYTFDAAGDPEYYSAGVAVKDGHLGNMANPDKPAPLGRPVYDPETHSATYPDGAVGSIAIDFTSGAAENPACQDHDGAILAAMEWTIDGISGTWCISPLVSPADRPAADHDLNGLWSAGASDSGWGLTVTETAEPDSRYINAQLYYYGQDNQPRWATPGPSRLQPGQPVDLFQLHGYCRTCAKASLVPQAIGTMTFNLVYPEHVELPSGDNSISVDINNDPGPFFQRSDSAMRMYSVPAGQ